MVLTDTHTHLYYETDHEKLEGLMQRCTMNNVDRLFLPNVNSESVPLVFGLADSYPGSCFPMLGLHPCDVKEGWADEWQKIQHLGSGRKIYAIGEIGIDLYWDKTTLNHQIDAFRLQIKYAKDLNLPIVIHCRDAFTEVYNVLEQEADDRLRGVFHCFTGNAEQAGKITALGFYLGIGGVVTYKNGGIDKVIPHIDIRHLVLETDSPYLTPVPHRGKRNESSYLLYVAQKVADIYGMDVETVAEITTRNSKEIFAV
ncbi:hydrolase TatD [Mucilaginibacter hurinus]|uniref:Hydrolase TatD n=1 Tax=Mucilaginibacter hurinus TaxID=2201324 RepID=A0A367GPV9_9SPHI|nr:TatD family hydrolase [Mucilaginibacter hurinus]RCH55494.1 hydrolase TatD [Mucilaginibacter hurinus]